MLFNTVDNRIHFKYYGQIIKKWPLIKFVSDLRQVGGFSLGIPVFSTNKAVCHDIAEILLKVTLNTKD
jgi:hypothetical protein